MAQFIDNSSSKKNKVKFITFQDVSDIKEYDDQYKLPKLALKLSGIRLTSDGSKCVSFLWLIYFWTAFTVVLAGTSNMTITFFQTGKFEDLVVVMPCVGFVAVALTKSYKIVRHRAVFVSIISELKAMWPRGEMSEEKRDIVGKMIKQLKVAMKGYFWCNMGLIFFFNFPPFYQIVKRLCGQDVPLIFSFRYVLPFDQYQKHIYPVILLIQTNACCSIVFFMLSSDLLFFVFVSNITLQFDLLSLRIKQTIYVPVDCQLVKDFPLGKYSETLREDETLEFLTLEEREQRYLNEIRDIVVQHRALIHLAQQVENLFNFPMLVNFLNSSVIICFCGICIVYLERWNELTYKFFLTSSISQIWMLCWYGQSLLDSSKGVANALYESGWYNVSNQITSLILIMLQRSQRAVYVTTYGFSVISLESYTTIIKTSWSYFTLLINTYKP